MGLTHAKRLPRQRLRSNALLFGCATNWKAHSPPPSTECEQPEQLRSNCAAYLIASGLKPTLQDFGREVIVAELSKVRLITLTIHRDCVGGIVAVKRIRRDSTALCGRPSASGF